MYCFADDAQLYLSVDPDDANQLAKLQACLKGKKTVMNSYLLLNWKQILLYQCLIIKLPNPFH